MFLLHICVLMASKRVHVSGLSAPPLSEFVGSDEVRQMMNAEKTQHRKTVREFLQRMETRDAAKNKLQWELQAQNVAEAQKECTFQPKTHIVDKERLPATTSEDRVEGTGRKGTRHVR